MTNLTIDELVNEFVTLCGELHVIDPNHPEVKTLLQLSGDLHNYFIRHARQTGALYSNQE